MDWKNQDNLKTSMILIWSYWTYVKIFSDKHESLERTVRIEWNFGPRRRILGVEFKMRRRDEVLVLAPFNQAGSDEPLHSTVYSIEL
ncbi:MAG: hypothetical protein ACE5H4_15490 [Candidatus Thorarchaeota archaeon]